MVNIYRIIHKINTRELFKSNILHSWFPTAVNFFIFKVIFKTLKYIKLEIMAFLFATILFQTRVP